MTTAELPAAMPLEDRLELYLECAYRAGQRHNREAFEEQARCILQAFREAGTETGTGESLEWASEGASFRGVACSGGWEMTATIQPRDGEWERGADPDALKILLSRRLSLLRRALGAGEVEG